MLFLYDIIDNRNNIRLPNINICKPAVKVKLDSIVIGTWGYFMNEPDFDEKTCFIIFKTSVGDMHVREFVERYKNDYFCFTFEDNVYLSNEALYKIYNSFEYMNQYSLERLLKVCYNNTSYKITKSHKFSYSISIEGAMPVKIKQDCTPEMIEKMLLKYKLLNV